jgi:hypothetical protein
MMKCSPRAFFARHLSFEIVLTIVLASALSANAALADRIKHPTAVFSGLDKITGRIISFEVATDETVQFGSLQITERTCYTRPATEAPQTITFVEVEEIDTSNVYNRIFTGWMFAASPGLHGIEHPIYDIWLTDCKGGREIVPMAPDTAEAEPAPPENVKPLPETPKPRSSSKPRRQPRNEDVFGESLPATPPETFPNQNAIEVGPPPGLIPNAPSQRRGPSQPYYPASPSPYRDPNRGLY